MSSTNEAAPRVSVLLPCYNGEAYLDEAIRSILRQRFTDFELIVVNDGSTDNSAAMVQHLAADDPRVRLLTKVNGGIVSALNAGLAECRGEFVARMDADDVAFPNRLGDQVAWLDAHPDCVCVGGYAVDDPVPTPASKRTTGGHHARTDLSRFPPKVAVAMHPLITVRRSALDAIGGYRGDYPHAEDYDLYIRLARFGRIDNPPVDMLFYRRHDGAISVRNVAEQERSAARSEVDAVVAAGLSRPPEWIIDSYVRLRIWRRLQSVDPVQAETMAPAILRDLLRATPASLLSPAYWRMRASTLRAFLRWRSRQRQRRRT